MLRHFGSDVLRELLRKMRGWLRTSISVLHGYNTVTAHEATIPKLPASRSPPPPPQPNRKVQPLAPILIKSRTMASDDLRSTVIQAQYAGRADSYDESLFHRTPAKDFVRWASPWLAPGASVLDLACGTGPAAIAAAQHMGLGTDFSSPTPTTPSIIGIDLTPAMLAIATQDSKSQNLQSHISPLHADIGALANIPQLQNRTFNVLSCCSALVLLSDPPATLHSWQRWLKPDGVLIFDVPAVGTQWVGELFGRVCEGAGREKGLSDRGWVTGYEVVRVWTTAGECERRSWKKEEAGGGLFEGMVGSPLMGATEGSAGEEEVGAGKSW